VRRLDEVRREFFLPEPKPVIWTDPAKRLPRFSNHEAQSLLAPQQLTHVLLPDRPDAVRLDQTALIPQFGQRQDAHNTVC
jgi:hypothetical protein